VKPSVIDFNKSTLGSTLEIAEGEIPTTTELMSDSTRQLETGVLSMQ
jgi:hypothetical protein